ncbi:SDR family NAD(P)-dependent oxidoreductase [Cohaesibacter celericrescens]|nr:SDR family oxidoreductase [Cohaesibacter celericrescens]
MGNLTGQTVLVTGAARGLGREYALHLASLGANVGVMDINFESFNDFENEARLLTAANVMEEIEALGVKTASAVADIGNREQVFDGVHKIAEELGDISIVITNAGGGMGPPDGNKASEMDWDMYHAVIDRNLHGTIYTCNAVAPVMKKNKYGKIITVASIGGLMANSDGSYAHYAVSKAGVIHYTQCLAQDLGKYGINVNCIAPGFVATGRLLDMYKAAGEDSFLNRTALRRFATPKDCAQAVEYLATAQSDYVTGHVLEVSGGVSGRMKVD